MLVYHGTYWDAEAAGATDVVIQKFTCVIHGTIKIRDYTTVLEDIRRMNAMAHPNVLDCHGCFVTRLEPCYTLSVWVVFDRMDVTLADWFSRDDVTLGQRCTVLLQLTRGMHTLHTHDMPHRDLRPECVFVVSGTVKITNFRVKTCVSNPSMCTNPDGSTYISPDASMDITSVDVLTRPKLNDVYAFGLVAWETLTGRRVYETLRRAYLEEHPYRLLTAIIRDGPPSWDGCEHIPGAVKAVISRCMSFTMKERPLFPEILPALEDVLGTLVEDIE